MTARCTDEEFARLWRQCPTVDAMSKVLQVAPKNIYDRRRRLMEKGIELPDRARGVVFKPAQARIDLSIEDGIIIVGSDCHYWPGEITAAHRAFVELTKRLRPWAIVLNGDILDGAGSVNRHGPTGWEKPPSMTEELQAVQERTTEIEEAARDAKLFRTHGNHDMRFDTALAVKNPDFDGVEGFSLQYHLPLWKAAWSIFVNGHTIITHRMKNGIHSTWTSTSDSQINTVCGHLHSLRVTPRTTLSPLNGGHLYGVDTGTMADPFGPQFRYVDTSGVQRNWRAGFAVLTFCRGILMPPEIVQVVGEDEVFFRGELIGV